MAIEWRPIPGYEGYYEVSSTGLVRSLDRTVVCANGVEKRLKGRALQCFEQPSGHLFVGLRRGEGKKMFRVHSAVMLAFVGPRPNGLEVRHLDGNPKNNSLENLAYGTRSQNHLDAYRHGGRPAGEDCHLAKISNAQAADLRALKGFVSSRLAAEHFGLSDSYVRQVWRNVRRAEHA